MYKWFEAWCEIETAWPWERCDNRPLSCVAAVSPFARSDARRPANESLQLPAANHITRLPSRDVAFVLSRAEVHRCTLVRVIEVVTTKVDDG